MCAKNHFPTKIVRFNFHMSTHFYFLISTFLFIVVCVGHVYCERNFLQCLAECLVILKFIIARFLNHYLRHCFIYRFTFCHSNLIWCIVCILCCYFYSHTSRYRCRLRCFKQTIYNSFFFLNCFHVFSPFGFCLPTDQWKISQYKYAYNTHERGLLFLAGAIRDRIPL